MSAHIGFRRVSDVHSDSIARIAADLLAVGCFLVGMLFLCIAWVA